MVQMSLKLLQTSDLFVNFALDCTGNPDLRNERHRKWQFGALAAFKIPRRTRSGHIKLY